MSKRTPIYNYLYLESGDVIYPGYDKDNQFTSENQIFGMYSYLGQGIISGWTIHWMGCLSDAYVLQQRQALIDAYRTDRFSYLALQYQSLNYPVTEADWKQCIVVKPGLGIIDVFHAATEYPTFFRFTEVNHYYVWAQKNVCTNTEYLCEIVAPEYPDEDYDLANQAIYIGEVFTGVVNSSVAVTQITYSERRRELKNAQGDIQRILNQALINHVHSGEGDNPSKINLSTNVTIIVPIIENSNTFTFTLPSGFNSNNYATPQVYLNSNLLMSSQYQISGSIIYLQNSVPITSSLQIVYQLAPGPNIYITSSLTPPLQNITLSFEKIYYLTDGTTTTASDGTQVFNVWNWNDNNYSEIKVYLSTEALDVQTYSIYQLKGVDNSGGRLKFIGPILPSILNYGETDVVVKFTVPSFEVTGKLSASRIASINASSFTRGTLSNARISRLDHLGLYRLDERATVIPTKKLLDSGDHIHFYPEIESVIQHSDYILNTTITRYVKETSADSTTSPKTIISTPNGLFASKRSTLDFSTIVKLPWNTDNGVADEFSENYFGNFNTYQLPGTTTENLNPKAFWILCKNKNQFKNVLYLSTNFGITYSKITIPFTSSGSIVTINDFIFTVNVFQFTVGEVILTPKLDVNYIYYIAATDGLYSATILRSQNKLKPVWNNPTKNTTNASTGSINKISEAVNVGTITTTYDSGLTERNYQNYRALYAACDSGLFVYQSGTGLKFTTNSTAYNSDNSTFYFSKWLGVEDSSNQIFAVAWADSYGLYFSNSGQKITTTSSSGSSRTVTITFYEPLTLSRTSTTTVSCASTENIDITEAITSIDGYSLVNAALVLLKNQTDSSQNGVYIWSSTSQLLYKQSSFNTKVYVTNGTQSQTEWIQLESDPENLNAINYALWFANILSLESNDQIVSIANDKSGGPNSNTTETRYYQSFFVATTKYIYRILNYNTPNIYPTISQINWDYENNGLITNIQHYSVEDPENGQLVVFTENGIFKSKSSAFEYGPLDSSGNLVLPNNSYERFINNVTAPQADNASVYDAYTLEEYVGKITSVSIATSIVTVPDGTYTNQRVYANNTQGSGLTVDLTIKSNVITSLEINRGGVNYGEDLPNPYVVIGEQKIFLQNAVTQGYFTCNYDSQYFVYSKSDGINPSSLLYEVNYTNFYVEPWNNFPLVTAKINNTPTNNTFGYNAETGEIVFVDSLPKSLKDSVTVSLTNKGQYISNTGDTPHGEVFNISIADSVPSASISSTYYSSSGSNILPLKNINNTRWNSEITSLKVTGLRPATNSSTLQSYTEILQVSVDTTAGLIVYIKSKPTTLPLTVNSNVFIVRPYDNVLGIEDKIFLSKSNLTYHMDSVSHANVYTLSNALTNINPDLYDYPIVPNETLSGVDRGLKNTIALKSLSEFDPTATFVGYTFGVDPSSSDVAASPSTINLILNFSYGNNPTFATNKGIWQYFRASKSWVKLDSVGDSNVINFADKTLTNSSNISFTYAGTDQGLFYQQDGVYTLDSLFTEPNLSVSMGSWYTSAKNTTKRFEAYGKDNSMSFVLRTTKTQEQTTTLQSDYFEGHTIYDLYYNTFYRYDDKGNRTEHPAIYLATDYSVWAFTTDAAPGSPPPSSRGANHTLLVGREMFGNNILRNINRLNPSALGIPVKVYKILEVPSGGRSTWLAVATSNGVYVVINWRQCDVGDPNGLTFYPQNKFSSNETVGHSCFVIIPKSTDTSNSTYFVGTEVGVFKSVSKCGDWSRVSKFDNQDLSVSDLKYFNDSSGNGILVAATNLGLWVSNDDGDTWSTVEDYNDPQVQIETSATYGSPLSDLPIQTFTPVSDGYVSKAFAYFNPGDLTGITTLKAYISNGTATTQSSSSIELNSSSYPGMYGFAFSNVSCVSTMSYSLGIVTDNATYASQVTWGLSNLNNPYTQGSASTSGGTLLNKDFFFRINLTTPATPTEVIEPVGFFNTSYSIGFASGTYLGASISSTGYLYSNVGILCNVVFDTSKSFEINDTAIITQSGVSTSYVRTAVINALVPTGINSDTLYTRLSNGFGTSKLLTAIYGFNNKINDLLFYSTANASSSSSCLTSSSVSFEGYSNNSSLISESISYVSNTGRLSKLYDAMLFNARLQFPAIVSGFYKNNLSQLDTNFINLQSVKEQYKSDFDLYLSLNLSLLSFTTYNVYYGDNTNNFVWVEDNYSYSIVVLSDGSCTTNFTFNSTNGTCTVTSLLTPLYLLLSKDWDFDVSISDLSDDINIWSSSTNALDLVTNQYALSFKPLIIVTTDGNDDSQATPESVNASLKVAYSGTGTQVLVIEPTQSGNENYLRKMIEQTNSKVFKYLSYPEDELKNVLFEEDSLNLLSSYWERKYDFDEPKFISYIYTSFVEPGNSSANVMFRWSADRVEFSNYISLINNSRYNLNQKVLAIEYLIDMVEDYSSNTRILPYVKQLYHVSVIPATQTYLTYPQDISGQLFETLALGSFTNSALVDITPIVGRTESADTSYYEQVQLNRNGALPNRQTSYRITPAFSVTGLKLIPVTNEENNSSYYIVDNNSTLYTWTNNDKFYLYSDGNPISPTAYSTVPESGILLITNIYTIVNGVYLYESFTAQIDYVESRETIIGEPTITYDYKTYYLSNGRIPTDAKVVVLVNQEIYKGIYTVSAYDGTITFASIRETSDYVTVFIQFANQFRAGLQIESYSADNLTLQSFNFTYTSVPNLNTYLDSFYYAKPFLSGSPTLSPLSPNIDSTLSLTYSYQDESNAPENGSTIQWWRQRTGIEYVTFNTAANLSVTGALVGINTFSVKSLYNQSENPFILSVTTNSNGITTNVVRVVISDRGSGFIGTGTNLQASVSVPLSTNPVTFATINNLGLAITAYTLKAPYTPGYATTDNFVRINPNSPTGYASTTFGYSSSVVLYSYPNYDGRLFEQTNDVAGRVIFDGRDVVYATVTPSNGVSEGSTYQSNPITINPFYTPVLSSLTIVGSISSYNGVSTNLNVFANTPQTPLYNFNYAISPFNQYVVINWFKLVETGVKNISSSTTLSSNLINASDQIYYTAYPAVIQSNGAYGFGNTVNSEIYTVI